MNDVTKLRVLTSKGITRFRNYIADRSDSDPPFELLTDPDCSASFQADVEVRFSPFSSKIELADYLAKLFTPIDRSLIDHNDKLWSWLGLFFFDLLCPKIDGRRSFLGEYRYILKSVDQDGHWRHYYRHLVAGPFTIARVVSRETAEALL